MGMWSVCVCMCVSVFLIVFFQRNSLLNTVEDSIA